MTFYMCGSHHARSTMASRSLAALIMLLFVSLAPAQEPLRYTIEEESEDTFIGDIIKNSGLDQEYTQADLDKMNFVFVESDEAHENLFTIEEGKLESRGPVDRDNICPYSQTCVLHIAIKIQPTEFFAIIQVEVEIVDKNDNIPSFQSSSKEVVISESTSKGSLISLPQADDKDSPSFGIQYYEMNPESLIFSLHEETIDGLVVVQLKVLEELDREDVDEYSLRLSAYDGGQQSSHVDITIEISDSNDNRPVFSDSEYEVSVSENLSPGFSIARVTATDDDIGSNAEIVYSFDETTAVESGQIFRLDSQTGQIYLRQKLDFETTQKHVLNVLAKDNHPEFTGALAKVTVTVIDYNDNRPNIKINDLEDGQTLQVPENEPRESFVAHLTVVDADSGDNGVFECSIDSDNFVLERLYPTEFKIITDVSFDRETRSQYTIRMSCQDNGSPLQRSSITIPIIISDQNDQVPIFQSSTFVGNTLENTTPGTFIMRVSAFDDDIGQNGEIEYHIDGPLMEKFNIGPHSGNISAKVSLDHERQNRYTFSVTAADKGTSRLSAVATVIIDIVDVDDNVPLFGMNSYTFSVLEHELAPAEVGTVTATDADSEPFNHFQYAMQSSDVFWIDNNTGEIYTKTSLDREAYKTPVFTTQVYAISSGFRPTTSTALVTIHIADINDHSPEIAFPSAHNNTLYVTNALRRGDVVGYVEATDADDGNNARLTYSFVGGNQENYFLIDAADGTILAHRNLASVDTKAFGLVVRVHDGGLPPKATEAFMNIVVNKSLAEEAEDIIKKTNLSIVISIACVSGCVIVTLIVAIAFIILQRRRQKLRSRYNNVPKVLSNDPFLQISPSVLQEKPTNQLERSYDNAGFSDDRAGDSQDGQFYKQNTPAPRDVDQDSACSADISNTDSGRGSNEDFSHDKIRHPPTDEVHLGRNLPSVHRAHNERKLSIESAGANRRAHRSRNSSESSAINKHNSWQINTANLQSGAYHARDYQPRRSFNSKNISHPSPLLDDPIYGDRRRNVLYRDMSPSPKRTNSGPKTLSHNGNLHDPGANPDYVILGGVGSPRGVLHEVHV